MKVRVSIECDFLPIVFTHECECDHHDDEAPCMLRIYKEAILVADEFVKETYEQGKDMVKNNTFENLPKRGGENLEA